VYKAVHPGGPLDSAGFAEMVLVVGIFRAAIVQCVNIGIDKNAVRSGKR